MNEFDQFVKHVLKVKYYARYTDDFVIIADNKNYLKELLVPIKSFLKDGLKLELHPNKVILRNYNQGVDFLGYIVLPGHIKLRTKTRQRIFRKLKEAVRRYKIGEISESRLRSSFGSYLGVLSHANAHKLRQDLQNKFWFWLSE